MSRLRFDDTEDGIKVSFADATFIDQTLDTLDRSAHTIRFETTFVHGHDNDVVRIFIDGHEVMRGGSWENYYRFYEERNPDPSDRLIIRTSGTAAPASLGGGFLFDDVTSRSYHVDNPAPLDPVVLPQGEKGDTGATGATGASGAKGTDGTNGSNGTNGSDGTNGANGEDGAAGSAGKDGVNGVTTIIRDYGKVSGARMRTVYAPKSKGKFVAVRAKLRGKSLPTSGRSIKVDLRGKPVGNYIVRMVAKYKKGGKTYKVRGHPEPEHRPQVSTGHHPTDERAGFGWPALRIRARRQP